MGSSIKNYVSTPGTDLKRSALSVALPLISGWSLLRLLLLGEKEEKRKGSPGTGAVGRRNCFHETRRLELLASSSPGCRWSFSLLVAVAR
ncbi:hypothetical protein KY284_010612 [Solanum tuberosum]|nr:hypothetical protein KY284_010612 [Solanum tuberosum]